MKSRKTIVLLASLSIAGATIAATGPRYNETVGGYTWSFLYLYDGEGVEKGVELFDFFRTRSVPAISPLPTGAIKIPSTLGGKPVESIGYAAFMGCTNLTSVIIPNAVTHIATDAFNGCTSMTNVTVGNSLTTIGNWAFEDCSSLKDITLPNSVTNIGSYAFNGCVNLEYASIGRAEAIQSYAFHNCTNLLSIQIPDSVTRIESHAFYNCDRLTVELRIPDSVTSIGWGAFWGCSGLTGELRIPDSVTSIGDEAFYYCSGLTGALRIPDSVTSIGVRTFVGCRGLTGELRIPDSVTFIGDGAFAGCRGLTGELRIPDSVTFIGDHAFSNCSGLTSVTIPDSVTIIANGFAANAFSGCGGLKSIVVDENNPNYCSINGLLLTKDGKTLRAGVNGDVKIPSGVERITDCAFIGLVGLTSVTIPDSVVRIDRGSFGGCGGLESIVVDENNPNYCSINGLLLTKDGKTLLEGVNGDVTIPNCVTNIQIFAFKNRGGLTRVTIPDSVTSIDSSNIFDGCENLKEICFEGVPPKFPWLSNVVGIYPSKFAAEWKAVIDENGYWHGLKMRPDEAEANYTIRYEANNGSGESVSETVAEGADCADVSAEDFEFTWEGHYFAGWAFAPGGDMVGSEEVAAEAQRNGGTVSLYARWLTLEPFSTDWESGTITLLFGGAKRGTSPSVECRRGGDPNAAWTSITGDIKWSMVNESVVSIDDPLYWSRYDGISPIEYRVVETETGFEARCTTRTKYAISVGVGLYERVLSDGRMIPWVGEGGDRARMADYAELFARLAKVAGAQEANIHTFTNERANIGNINHAFESVSTTIRPGDICLLYFGTHGGADGTASKLALYGNKEYYTEAALANHIDSFSPDWGVATVCIVHACESGGFANNENDQYCVGGGWCVNEQLVSRNAAWITATDKPDVSAYGESFLEFLLDYGWEGGWAGAEENALTFGNLADYIGKTYDVLFSGVRVGHNPDVIKAGVTNKPLLSRVVAGICPRHEAKAKPTAFSVTASTDNPSQVVLTTSRLSADTLQVFSRFVNGGEWSNGSVDISNSGDGPHQVGMDSTVVGEAPITRHSSVDDKMEFIVKAFNGAGVTAATAKAVGWRSSATLSIADGELTGVELNGATDVAVPASVTSIASGAFRDLADLKSVTISAGVTNIHAWAFDGCSGLESVAVADDNPAYRSDGGLLLTKDGTTLVQGVNGDVVIPSGVATVGDSAFYQLSGLTSVEIPDGVETIEDYAFGYSALTSVTIPASVAGIGDHAFGHCGSLERLVFLGDAPVADSSAFEEVGSGCTVYVEKGSTGWGVEIPGTWNGMRIEYRDGGEPIPGPGPDVLPDLPEGYAAYSDGTYTWVYRESYTADGISLAGFYHDDDPDDDVDGECMRGVYPAPTGKVAIPSTVNGLPVVELGDYLFWDCADLTGVEIPDAVQYIGMSAFEGSGLVSVELPDSVTIIGHYAFWDVPLESVNVPSDIGYVGDRAFHGTPWLAAQGDFVFFGDGYLIAYQGTDVDVDVPDSADEIGPGAFARTSVESVRIPASVDLIRDRAFYMCESLADVSFEGNMNDILMDVEQAFEGTPWLAKLLSEPPTNDDFANAAVLEGRSGSVRGTSFGATVEDGEPPAVRWGSTASVWWRWTAPASGTVAVSTAGSGFDTVLGVYTGGTVGTLTVIAENDDAEGVDDYSSAVEFEMTAGTTYYIAVAGCRGAAGRVALSWSASYWYATVYFNPTGGEVSEVTRNVYSGQKVGTLSVPVREGYEFVGWFDEDGGQMTPDTIIHYGVEVFARWRLAGDPDGPLPSPIPTPTPEPVVVPELYEEVDGAAPAAAASVYDGYLVDAKGNVAGSIQIKVGKTNAKTGLAAVKATAVIGGKKVALKVDGGGKVAIAEGAPTVVALSGGGESFVVTLGAEGLSGTYGNYEIDGARNFFASKDKGEQGAANDILSKWLEPVSVVWNGGSVNVSIAKKGKAKVKGTLANGTKVSAKSVFLVGEEWCAVPVVAPKANLTFTLWLSRDGRTVAVEGLGDGAIAGKPGTLKAGAKFHVDKTAALWSQIAGKVFAEYLPDGMTVSQSGTKWTLPKAGKVQKAKDGTIDSSKLGENPSALKLSYKAKDGSFKGSFKVYAENKGKLKATTVNVTGVVVDGTGYGTATIKKVGSVQISIE